MFSYFFQIAHPMKMLVIFFYFEMIALEVAPSFCLQVYFFLVDNQQIYKQNVKKKNERILINQVKKTFCVFQVLSDINYIFLSVLLVG